jgi:acyl-CoA synthetase (AMP-forming)/AMP-acid ligase II
MWLRDTLLARTQKDPQRVAFCFEQGAHVEQLSYGGLLRDAVRFGALIEQHVPLGSPVILLLDPGLDFIRALFGAMCAGRVPVPVAVPRGRSHRVLSRLHEVARDAGATHAITTVSIADRLSGAELAGVSLQWILCDAADLTVGESETLQVVPEPVAFLQYTSGSVGSPKGVVVSWDALQSNLARMQTQLGLSADTRGVSWLPPHHDMGLVGCILEPFYVGFAPVLMSPYAFAQRPIRWLELISRHRAELSPAPTFAYDLCVQRVSDDQVAELSLGQWRTALVGAERVDVAVLRAFARKFAAAGFRPEALCPCYGLAESVLMVSSKQPGVLYDAQTVSRGDLVRGRLRDATDDPADAATLVGCGSVVEDHEVVIVEPQTGVTAELGEIWVRGPSIARGYWNRPEDTRATFQGYLADGSGPYLRTGDLGFIRDTQLYIYSRSKTLLVVRGQNISPEDLEASVQLSHPALSRFGVAAFTLDEFAGDRAVVVCEVQRDWLKSAELAQVFQRVQQTLGEAHGLRADLIVLVKPGSVPRTTSGKVQRFLCRSLLKSGDLPIIAQQGSMFEN